MDEYHLRFGREVYHICELAEHLERCQATCTPEQEITEDECAWKLGNKGYLYVQVSEDGYDYQLYIPIFQNGMVARWIWTAP